MALIREFTKIAERKPLFDDVYILNKYYAACGEIIDANVWLMGYGKTVSETAIG